MKCTIKAFGISKDIVGGKIVEVELSSGQTVVELRNVLMTKYPAFAALKSVFIAVNHEYAEGSLVLKEGDEIALIPPVSGG